MRVLVTGAGGFIGSNLAIRLGARPDTEVLRYAHGEPLDILRKLVAQPDRQVGADETLSASQQDSHGHSSGWTTSSRVAACMKASFISRAFMPATSRR